MDQKQQGIETLERYTGSEFVQFQPYILLTNFHKYIERHNLKYHTGVIHTTNVRMWEFKEDFVHKLVVERSQAIDMECATLFTVGFVYQVPIGALILISDLPLRPEGIKTKASAATVLKKHSELQVEIGINVLLNMQKDEGKGFGYAF
jgi:AMP nucleosidase